MTAPRASHSPWLIMQRMLLISLDAGRIDKSLMPNKVLPLVPGAPREIVNSDRA
jgi:hypothetical protein